MWEMQEATNKKKIWHFDLCAPRWLLLDFTWTSHSEHVLNCGTRPFFVVHTLGSSFFRTWTNEKKKSQAMLSFLSSSETHYLFRCFFFLLSRRFLGWPFINFTIVTNFPHSSRNLIALNQLNSFCQMNYSLSYSPCMSSGERWCCFHPYELASSMPSSKHCTSTVCMQVCIISQIVTQSAQMKTIIVFFFFFISFNWSDARAHARERSFTSCCLNFPSIGLDRCIAF